MVDETPTDQFWRLVDPLLDEEDVTRGTLMRDCLRVGQQLAAAPHHDDDGLIVKLPRERVAALVLDGVAEPFAPAGRVFREWARVRNPEADLWKGLIDEAVAFARG
jgi:hypothetical protein